MSTPDIPQPLLDQIRRCQSVVAFTGAGISAESGVPTFRDAQTGLWAQFSPLDLATPEAFKEHPQRVSSPLATAIEISSSVAIQMVHSSSVLENRTNHSRASPLRASDDRFPLGQMMTSSCSESLVGHKVIVEFCDQ